MLNFKNAWLGLIGKLPDRVDVRVEVEKEVTVEVAKEVVGKAATVMLYQFRRPTGKTVPNAVLRDRYKRYKEDKFLRDGLNEAWRDATEDEIETVYAHTCEQAHAECKGAAVTATPCIRVGNSYFQVAYVQPIKVLNKPKVTK